MSCGGLYLAVLPTPPSHPMTQQLYLGFCYPLSKSYRGQIHLATDKPCNTPLSGCRLLCSAPPSPPLVRHSCSVLQMCVCMSILIEESV